MNYSKIKYISQLNLLESEKKYLEEAIRTIKSPNSVFSAGTKKIACKLKYESNTMSKSKSNLINKGYLKKAADRRVFGSTPVFINFDFIDAQIALIAPELSLDNTSDKERKLLFEKGRAVCSHLKFVDSSKISRSSLDIFKTLILLADKKGRCPSDILYICKNSGFSEKTAKEKLRDLEGKNLIQKIITLDYDIQYRIKCEPLTNFMYSEHEYFDIKQDYLLKLQKIDSKHNNISLDTDTVEKNPHCLEKNPHNNKINIINNINNVRDVFFSNKKKDEKLNKDASQEAASVELSNKEINKHTVENTVDKQDVPPTPTNSPTSQKPKKVMLFSSRSAAIKDTFGSTLEMQSHINALLDKHIEQGLLSIDFKTKKELFDEVLHHVKARPKSFSEGKAINSALKMMREAKWSKPKPLQQAEQEHVRQEQEREALRLKHEQQEREFKAAYSETYEQFEARMQKIKLEEENFGVKKSTATTNITALKAEEAKQEVLSIDKITPKDKVRPDTPMPVWNKPETILPTEIPSIPVNYTAKELTDGIFIASHQTEEEKERSRRASACLFDNEAFKAELANKEEVVNNNDDIDDTDISHIASLASFTSSYHQAINKGPEIKKDISQEQAARNSLFETYTTFLKTFGAEKTLQMVQKSSRFDIELFNEAVDAQITPQISPGARLKPY